MSDTSLENILSGAASARASETTVPVDEPDTVIDGPSRPTFETDEAPEGQSPPDASRQAEEPTADKAGSAFKAQREDKARRYTEQVERFERQLAERDAFMERRFNELAQLLARQQQAPAQQQPAQQPEPDLFADPQGYLAQALAPVRQELQQTREYIAQREMAQKEQFSRVRAVEKFGPQAVEEAYREFADEYRSNPTVHYEWQAIMASQDPYGALMERQNAKRLLKDTGGDLASLREQIKTELMAELSGTNGQFSAPQHRAAPSLPNLPSNLADARNAGARAGPAWAGPVSFKEIFDRKK